MQSFDRGTWMLVEAVKCLQDAKNGIVVAAEIAQGVIVGHYAERLNERGRERRERLKSELAAKKLPTDSVTFDADHASLALRRADVFVTQDENLGEVAAKLLKGLGSTFGLPCRGVVGDPDSLRGVLTALKAGG
jgi:hypothetical protein